MVGWSLFVLEDSAIMLTSNLLDHFQIPYSSLLLASQLTPTFRWDH